MTSISKSPVRWRGEGRAPALKERGSPSEAFRKPVITDPTYIKRCRQPPASHQPARSVSSVSLFAFFSPSSPSSSSLCFTCAVPFVPLSFFLTSSSFSRAHLLVHSSVFFSLLSSLSFFLSTLSGLPLRLRQRSTLFDPSPQYASKGLSDSSFILPSYFTYLLTHSRFLSTSPPFLPRLFLFISSFLCSLLLFFFTS